MKRLVLAASLSFVASFALASDVSCDWTKQKVSFNYYSHRSFYSCNYAEKQARWVIESLGGRITNLHCTGGLPWEDTVYLTAQFESLSPSDNGVVKAVPRPVQLKVEESCDFNEQLIREFSKKFTVINKKVTGVCRDSQGRQTYNFTVLQ